MTGLSREQVNACGKISITDCSDSTAPFGLPGRFRMSVCPRTPHKPRLRTANGVFAIPSARIFSGYLQSAASTPRELLPA